MTQPLWYLRHQGKVYGPFPVPQIDTALAEGDVTPEWEVSLNESDWLTIAESGQFNCAPPDLPDAAPDSEARGWREERQRARQRWLREPHLTESAVQHDLERDARARQAISTDHAATEALLREEKHKRTSPLAALLATLMVLSVGVAILWGQREKPIQAKIALVADCASLPGDGMNWTSCDKRGLHLPGMRAHNARLERVRLDEARLSGADLTYAMLRGASLRNAQLSGSILVGVDLTGADLSGADLTGADLRFAVLAGANITGVRIDSARLGKAVWTDGRSCEDGAPGACR